MNKMAGETLYQDKAVVFTEGSEESRQSVRVLRKEGYFVTTIPITGLWGPKIFVGGRVFEGLEQFLNHQT